MKKTGKTKKAPTATALSGPFKSKFSGKGINSQTNIVRDKVGKQFNKKAARG